MKINIGLLKNDLSKYLHKVRAGMEITVTDRNEPVAKISPLERRAVRVDLSDWLRRHPAVKTTKTQPSSVKLLRQIRDAE